MEDGDEKEKGALRATDDQKGDEYGHRPAADPRTRRSTLMPAMFRLSRLPVIFVGNHAKPARKISRGPFLSKILS
jgi:hypothetical protein